MTMRESTRRKAVRPTTIGFKPLRPAAPSPGLPAFRLELPLAVRPDAVCNALLLPLTKIKKGDERPAPPTATCVILGRGDCVYYSTACVGGQADRLPRKAKQMCWHVL